MQTRKEFLRHGLALVSGAALLGHKAWAAEDLQPDSYTFDLHCHPGQIFASASGTLEANAGAVNTIADMNSVSLGGALFALVADTRLLQVGPAGISVTGKYKAGEGWAEYKRQLKVMKDFLSASDVGLSTAVTARGGDVAAFLAVEGGDFLEGSLDHLEEAYADGIRSVQLVHYAPNDLGDLQTAEVMHNGLSPTGKNVVKKMNALGMVVDVAHASFKTVRDVVEITSAPIILSHSVLAMEADRPIAKRAISHEHAKLVAGTGGVIGMWPSGFNRDFAEYVDNTMRMVEVAGIDHVGIGTDMDANYKPVLSSYAQFADLSNALGAKGLSQDEVGNIMGGNAWRVLSKVV